VTTVFYNLSLYVVTTSSKQDCVAVYTYTTAERYGNRMKEMKWRYRDDERKISKHRQIVFRVLEYCAIRTLRSKRQKKKNIYIYI